MPAFYITFAFLGTFFLPVPGRRDDRGLFLPSSPLGDGRDRAHDVLLPGGLAVRVRAPHVALDGPPGLPVAVLPAPGVVTSVDDLSLLADGADHARGADLARDGDGVLNDVARRVLEVGELLVFPLVRRHVVFVMVRVVGLEHF